MNENNIKLFLCYTESRSMNSIKNSKIKKKLFEELKKNNITFIDLTNKKYLNFDQNIFGRISEIINEKFNCFLNNI